MTHQNYTTAFLVDQTPAEAFAAINNIPGWWSQEFNGSSHHLNDEFEVRFGEVHYSKQKLTAFIPHTKIDWLVTDSYLNFLEDKNEWTGTTIRFELSPKGDKTEVRLTHIGLVPHIECFDACSNAWSSYLNGSLRSFITTGQGQPHLKEQEDKEKAM